MLLIKKIIWLVKKVLKLLNQPEEKIYKYFNTKKMKKDQVTFED